MKEFNIGVRLHDILTLNTFAFGEKLKNAGVDCVQLALPQVFTDFDFFNLDFCSAAAKRLKDGLKESGVKVSVLSCYINPLDVQGIETNKRLFKKYIDYARYLDIPLVGTETGTVTQNLKEEYKKNQTDEMFERLIENMSELFAYADNKGVGIAIEGVSYFPVHSSQTMTKFKNALKRKKMNIIFDPVNLLRTDNYFSQETIYEQFVAKHHESIRVVHLKDFRIENGRLKYLPPGEGLLKRDALLRILFKYHVQCAFILENTTPHMYHKAIQDLRDRLNDMGNSERIGKIVI
jgi:sugar phosphate isomerase/epimerase